ncbi:MAG: hypothetical protein JW955_18465 [Sedimentisphaerales bacterium]|nr:hypothetical protein [Sedimentisphaerales bacterium]
MLRTLLTAPTLFAPVKRQFIREMPQRQVVGFLYRENGFDEIGGQGGELQDAGDIGGAQGDSRRAHRRAPPPPHEYGQPIVDSR